MDESKELFTARMRKETRTIHSMSDALVNAKFLVSLHDESVWAGGLFVFYHVFSFLEDAKKRLDMQDYNDLFVNDALFRKQAFEEDLTHYFRKSDWKCLPKSPELVYYLKHLEDLEKDNPKLLMAYVYHLYMGLLSGGQILLKKRQMFPGSGTNSNKRVDKVLDFSLVEIPKLKKDLQSAMNRIAEKMSEEEKQLFIEESNQMFIMNNAIVGTGNGQNQFFYRMFAKALRFCVSAAPLIFMSLFILYTMYFK